MPKLLCAQGGVCPSFCGLRGGYAGTFVGSGGYAGSIVGLGGVCRNLCVLRGGMPELLGA